MTNSLLSELLAGVIITVPESVRPCQAEHTRLRAIRPACAISLICHEQTTYFLEADG